MNIKLVSNILILFIMLLLSQISQAESSKKENLGTDDYIKNCAVCHGKDGKGNGHKAKQLSPRPSDLTMLSKNNGGSFPETAVYNIIDGRSVGDFHGQEMPVWGEYFQDIEDEDDEAIDERISRIIKYIESIQIE